MNGKSRRVKSISLMKALQPFMQGGILKPAKAQIIIKDWTQGDNSALADFILDPSIPMIYEKLAEELKQFIQN